MKRCPRCSVDLPLTDFSVRKEGKPYSYCKPCVRRAVRAHKTRLLDLLRTIKDRPCADCGRRFHFSAMDFDHRPGHVKRMILGGSHQRGSLVAILAELKKCDVVCSNCHRVRTYNRHRQLSSKGKTGTR